jgi:hypothetical protein
MEHFLLFYCFITYETMFFFSEFSHCNDQKKIECEIYKRFIWKNIVKSSQCFEEKILKLPNGVLELEWL